MSKEVFLAVKAGAWVLVTALCWTYAAAGYSSHPRFDMWFWGIAFAIDVIVMATAVAGVALKW